jgi:hypothetical protein
MSNQLRQPDEFENLPSAGPMDETDRSLRAYVSQISDEKVRQYQPEWTDEQVIDWDGNFRSDGCLMLVCCERDVDVVEFRRVLGEYLTFRKKWKNDKRVE